MRWDDEWYVKVYVRDTITWDMLNWQARALWPLLLRKVDRAGLLDLGPHGMRGLSVLVKLPEEVVTAGFGPGDGSLLTDGLIELRGTLTVVPNFVEAQAAKMSDKLRKQQSRARARDIARAVNLGVVVYNLTDENPTDEDEHLSRNVTPGHVSGQVDTKRDNRSRPAKISDKRSRSVTKRQEDPEPATPPAAPLPLAASGQALSLSDFSFPSQASGSLPGVIPETGTLCSSAEHADKTGARVDEKQTALPILSDAMTGPRRRPKRAPPPTPTASSENALADLATALLSELNDARARVIPGCDRFAPIRSNLVELIARLREGNTANELRHVIAVAEAKVRAGEQAKWMNPTTPFRLHNISRYLAENPGEIKKRAAPDAGPGRMPSVSADEVIRRLQGGGA